MLILWGINMFLKFVATVHK